MTRAKLRNEDGWVLITATVLLSVMLVMGLAAMTLVNSDSHRTREQRETESALNVDEGVLYAQSMVLGQNWPSLNNHAYAVNYCDSATATPPASAGAATGASLSCPNPQNLAGSGSASTFNNVDTASQTTWKTKVRDNGGSLATSYDPTKADLAQGTCASPCNYDFNGDGQLWVQAQTITRGHPRNVVARLRLEKLSESVPQAAVTSGALSITNNGNHGGTPIIDATGSQVLVRCTSSGNNCINANSGQITPTMPTAASSGAIPPNLMTPDQLARFKQRAITDGHYFAGCPSNSSNLAGAVVWVEGCTSPPNMANSIPTVSCGGLQPAGMSNGCVNTVSSPGMLIWHCGRADFSGSWTYHGLLYMVNNSDGTCPASLPQEGNYTCSSQPATDPDRDVMTTDGGFGVWGAVAVDGPACLKVGSNNLQITFDPKVFDAVESYGTVGLVQNTWRELDPRSF